MENLDTSILDKCVATELDGEKMYIYTPSTSIIKFELLEDLKAIYDLETSSNEYKFLTKLKGLDTDLLAEAFRYSMSRKDLKDPMMILNIVNLIKIYNTLDDSFFNHEDIYVSSIENLIDIRLELQEEIEAFIKELSIYFLSLFKSYNKVTYTPTDNHKMLPSIYKIIFMTNDSLTLSGIFSVSIPFSTDECVFLDDARECLFKIQEKDSIGLGLLFNFFGKE